MDARLPKSERLSGVSAVSGLLLRGKSGSCGCIRYKFLRREGSEPSRIVVSVPKRHFHRAVKRNLLKRRIRESYRLQKQLLTAPVDILFIYSPREVLPSGVIFADMTAVLEAVSKALE